MGQGNSPLGAPFPRLLPAPRPSTSFPTLLGSPRCLLAAFPANPTDVDESRLRKGEDRENAWGASLKPPSRRLLVSLGGNWPPGARGRGLTCITSARRILARAVVPPLTQLEVCWAAGGSLRPRQACGGRSRERIGSEGGREATIRVGSRARGEGDGCCARCAWWEATVT